MQCQPASPSPQPFPTSAQVDQPTTVLYYRYSFGTIRSEREAFGTIKGFDGGTGDAVTQGLGESPLGEPVSQPTPVPAAKWEEISEKARHEVANILIPLLQDKREEAQEEVRRTEKRLEAYYERQKEEIRAEEAKIRPEMGKSRTRSWFTESGVRERRPDAQGTAYPSDGLIGMMPLGRFRSLARAGETLLQEMGHVLGLGHSEIGTDIMYHRARNYCPNLDLLAVSDRGKQMLIWLYNEKTYVPIRD